MVTFKYALTKEDYANYYTYIKWDAPGNRKKRLMHYTRQLLPIALFIAAFYYTDLLGRQSTSVLLVAGLLIITALLSVIGVRTTTMKQAEKIADDPDNASIFQEVTGIASETGITLKGEQIETRYQWSCVIKKLESQNYYFLFINAMQAIIIPKRVFNSPGEKLHFEKLLSQHISFDAELSHLIKS